MKHLRLPAAVRATAISCALALVLGNARPAAAQAVVSTVAGTGTAGTADGPAATAQFNGPNGVVVDAQGNCYVSDSNNNAIRLISAAGVVTQIAGNGGFGYFDHPNGLFSAFSLPYGLTLGPAGSLYVADAGNGSIRQVALPAGGVSTWAGNGQRGYQDGPGPAARFGTTTGVTSDAAGNLYVADAGNFRLRRVDPAGNVTTLAGTGVSGMVDGPAATAQFREPQGLARDAAGNLYVADRTAHRIRKLSPAGVVSTYAGTGVKGSLDGPALSAQFSSPTGLALDAAGNLYVLDRDNPRVRRIDATTGAVSTVAGTGVAGFADGPALQAQFNIPYGLSISPNGRELYIADAGNHRIRRLALGPLAAGVGRALNPMMSLFPNPAAGLVRVSATLPAGVGGHLTVLDAVGHRVAEPVQVVRSTATSWEWTVDVAALSPGLYLCRITGNSFTQTLRLMVKP
ncbi:T9SS type A sorting domain-containing protein [Hymenobacter monticola]|uniref:T9SS type A sorting domain-containing protein n=1 Tax=Hymenobacter monticola TaxID=1705399 RepID=A0ABY4B5Z6_9BACT|nr:T9SS type A sorting domain-containing protein [Hymenobacter monticola]UOE34596.1 T9SS type A sorting domain-containing protein [Hymenobacter monticola]